MGIAITCASILAIGMVWPKEYASKSTILIVGKSMLTPLLAGIAVTSSVKDHIKTAREIIYSRESMGQLLNEEFWGIDDISPIEKEFLIKSIVSKTKIATVGKQLIQIKFTHQNPEVAYLTTQKITEIYLEINQQHKINESENAFDFIDQQVQLYHKKLIDADKELEIFRKINIGATPDSLKSVNRRLSALHSNIEKTHMDIKEAAIVRSSIKQQLNDEMNNTESSKNDEVYRFRINRLQSQLDDMKLKYHDSYPDVVTIKTQIEELKKSQVSEDNITLDKTYNLAGSEFIQGMKGQLVMANTKVVQLRTRLDQLELIKIKEEKLVNKINKVESQLIEMRRDYAVNNDIYQTLLRKKETARVSMNINLANQGMTLRIQEHATLPLVPQGLNFFHFSMAALLIGLTLPVGLVYGISAVDGQVRSSRELHDNLGLPVLGMAGYLSTPKEEVKLHKWKILAGLFSLGLIMMYMYINWLYWGQS